MKKNKLELMTLLLCLLFAMLVFPKNTLALGNPSAPTNLSATAESSSEIYLDWDSVSGATSYYVYRARSYSGTYSKIATTTISCYSDDDLSDDTTYYYKVKAVDGSDTSSFSAIVQATTDEDTLSAPADLSATAQGPSAIYLDWDSVSGASSYYIYRAATSSGAYSKITTTATSSYTDDDLSEDTTYYYKVKAVNDSGSSPFSSIAHATTDASDSGTLSAPTDLNAEALSSSRISLDWDTVSDATSYYIYRAGSYSGNYAKIATTKSSSYTNTGLSDDSTYYYKVKAVNGSDMSPFSPIAHATTDASDTLSEPTDLSATALSFDRIYLDWDSISDASSYYVYRATSSSGTYSKIATTTTSSYTDTGLLADTTYYYKVRAVDGSDTSDYSSVTSCSTAELSQIPSARLAGKDMYDTSAAVAQSGWVNSYYAIIVSGETFADALCSAPLANKYHAPILLTSKDTLNEQTRLQLSRLNVKHVLIIGGVGVISSGVEERIKNMSIEVSRIAGYDRYETSLKVAQSMGQVDQAVLASGESFPDALSIAPIASMKGIPILLTPKDYLPGTIKAYLSNTIKTTYVVGGTGVVSENVFRQLPSPKRLSGFNRYETNISIMKEFADELDFSICYLATGESFADALAGSALASLSNSPVILVNNPVAKSTKDFFDSKTGNSIKKITVFGGLVVVPENILTSITRSTYVSTTLPAPTDVTAETLSSSRIKLTWDSVSGATSYYVYRATSYSGSYTQIATLSTTHFISSDLRRDTTYYYKVKAVNDTGSSSYSSITDATTNSSD